MTRYELLDRIGKGGMAEIFRGKAIAGGGFEKPVAIKRILPHLSQDKRFVELLITEAKTLSQLRHRNIVQIYDVGLGDDGQYFLVMEFVEGTDLGALYEGLEKRGRRLTLDVALHIAAEVCEALDHAHRARSNQGTALGLVHRDVTPSNVLLSRSGEVKLTDFGIAKRTEEATGHGAVRGKFAYISPEQAANQHVDARSDVYSVGVLLYEMALGQRLFSGLPDFEALRAVRDGRVVRPRDIDPRIDPELEALLLSALARDPAQRFPSAGNFGAKLRSFRYGLAATVGDPSKEIAQLVESAARSHREELVEREPTVVRIATAAGFSGAIDVRDGRAASPFDMFDDDEETRALPPGMVARLGTGEVARSAGASAGALGLEVGEAEPGSYPGREGEPTMRFNPLERSTLDDGRERAATPTIRELFYRGELVDSQADLSPPAFPATPGKSPILKPQVGVGRRRAIIIAGIAAAACAVAAFVIVGLLLGGGSTPAGAVDAAPPGAMLADAGVVRSHVDAGATSDNKGAIKKHKKRVVKKRHPRPRHK